MVASCCVRGCGNRGSGVNKKIKYYRFPQDEARRMSWIKAINREHFVPTKNTMICNAHFTVNDYQKRPDLIKLTNSAVPSVFNCVQTVKNYLNQKCSDNLLDHTDVHKLPESPEKNPEPMNNSFISSSCMVQTSEVIENFKIEPKPLDLSTSEKPTLINNKNPYFQIKDPIKNSETNWKEMAIAQSNTIKDLKKKAKFLHQKFRRDVNKIKMLQDQLKFHYSNKF